jgi:hypothetical protein
VSEQPTKEDLNMPGDRTSKELVKSLRDYSEGPTFYWGPICQKAAEEIERLQRELAASAAQYQEACDDANRFARERDEARASPEPSVTQAALDAAWEALTIWVPDSHTKANALELIGKARAELTKGAAQ